MFVDPQVPVYPLIYNAQTLPSSSRPTWATSCYSLNSTYYHPPPNPSPYPVFKLQGKNEDNIPLSHTPPHTPTITLSATTYTKLQSKARLCALVVFPVVIIALL